MKHTLMNLTLSTVVAVGSVAALAPAGQAAPAGGWTVVESYCSESGDVCFGIKRKGDSVKFQLDSFVDFGPVDFCVKKKGKPNYVCHSRNLKEGKHSLFRAKILWNNHYPTGGSKKRIVRFSQGYPKLSFHP